MKTNSASIQLSVIIVSYNTSALTLDCLKSLTFALKQERTLISEIIIIDNASSDSSVEDISSFIKKSKMPMSLIVNKKNVGFGRANNQAVQSAKGKYILLLNSDTLIEHVDFTALLNYFAHDKTLGILTVAVRFPHGAIDPASHRGFPTIWRSFCYFSGLEKITFHTPLNRIFGGYHLTHRDLTQIHEIDCPAGAFFLLTRDLYRQVKGFDEDFFMYGEDLDLAYRIKQLGYRVIYYPMFVILHLKHQSGLQADKKTRKITRHHFYEAMKIFYRKHYARHHPKWINTVMYKIIDFKATLLP